MLVVDLLTGNISEADPEAGPESNISEPSNPESQTYYFLNLNIEVPWLILFSENEKYHEGWQNNIQYAKDIFKVNEAKYAFLTWFIDTKEHKLEARMTEEQAQEILNAINNSEYLIRIKFIQADTSKRTNSKYIKSGQNVILTKKTKLGFWIGIDEKFLVREVSRQSEVGELDSNAVVYGLYQIQVPDINRLMLMKNGALNLQDVTELEKILKQPIKLLDITYSTIFNSKKYRLGKYEEIEMKKYTDIINACKELFEDVVNWQFQEGIISEEKKELSKDNIIGFVQDMERQKAECLLYFYNIFSKQASMLAYAYINLLKILRRFDPNEVVSTDSIYVRKDALYKIENIPAFFKQVEEWFYSRANAKIYKSDSYALLHQPEEQEIQKIQPGQ
ncbi:24655_t:CDS:2 [Cetraspora pellucida]|uniref:24655_t:CDS:1 n=1 Tax=Cetraspora pellucida TaxID=1433469 RepID=A0A9N9HWW8_9GLOM|nr:24655_t:CDS:2 [Cetraspora pellucida]